jgi:diacylglycerol kinase (ATP)
MTGVLILLNPSARGGRAARLEAPIRYWLDAHSHNVALVATRDVQHADELLRDLPERSRVVIVGGDGSVHQALPALLAKNHTLAIAPFGSGDDAARAIGVHGMTWQNALQFALMGKEARMDIGLAHFNQKSVPFAVCLNAGLDAAISLRAVNGPSWLNGLPRYLLATLRELIQLRMWDIAVEIDGETTHSGDALFTSALNTATFGSGMPAVPHALIDDALLNMLHAAPCSRARTMILLPRLLTGKHLSDRRVSSCAFQSMVLTGNAPIPLAADGEYLGESQHVRIEVQPGTLSVVRRTTH